jgi:hypothetical protein
MSRSTNGHREDDAAAAIQAIDDMGEVELGQVRLIGDGSRDGNRSWDPKRGEPRQHISTVLGEAFYSSQRFATPLSRSEVATGRVVWGAPSFVVCFGKSPKNLFAYESYEFTNIYFHIQEET